MSLFVPDTANSVQHSVLLAAAQFAGSMVVATSSTPAPSIPARKYQYVATTDSWIAQGANPTAVVGAAGSMFVPAKLPVLLDPKYGAKLSTIRDTADGSATLTPGDLA